MCVILYPYPDSNWERINVFHGVLNRKLYQFAHKGLFCIGGGTRTLTPLPEHWILDWHGYHYITSAYFNHFLIALSLTPYFLPVPQYPNSLISISSCSIVGLSTFLSDLV